MLGRVGRQEIRPRLWLYRGRATHRTSGTRRTENGAHRRRKVRPEPVNHPPSLGFDLKEGAQSSPAGRTPEWGSTNVAPYWLAQSTGWCSRLACQNASTWRVPFSAL